MGFGLGNGFNSSRFKSTILQKVFARCEFLVLRYPRYPIEIVPVEPLHAKTISSPYVMERSLYFRMTRAKRFFSPTLSRFDKGEVRAAGVRGWLQLAQELHQDGFIKFGGPLVKPGELRFEGAVNVIEASGEGGLRVIMEFTEGRLPS